MREIDLGCDLPVHPGFRALRRESEIMKKKKPQDATLRNTKAAKKRTDSLLARIKRLEERVAGLEKWNWL